MKSWLVGLIALSGAVSLAQEPVEREWFGVTNTGEVERSLVGRGDGERSTCVGRT